MMPIADADARARQRHTYKMLATDVLPSFLPSFLLLMTIADDDLKWTALISTHFVVPADAGGPAGAGMAAPQQHSSLEFILQKNWALTGSRFRSVGHIEGVRRQI